MFKKISAALLVASIFAAPAMAAGAVKADVAPITKSVKLSPKVLNAKASMRHIHHNHIRHHHRFHKHAVVLKKQTVAHVVKVKPIVKRISSLKPAGAKIRG
jgi:hypothetical protein